MVACAVVCLCALACFHGLPLVCLGKKWKWRVTSATQTEKASRVERVVFGGTLWYLDTPPRQQARPFHSLSCRPKQVHSTFRGASSVPSPWFFGWDICSSLSSSFGVLTACSAESLVQTSLSSLAQGHPESVFTATGFLIHSNCPCDGFVEVRHRGPLDLVRAPLVFVRYRACFLLEGEKVLGDFPGLCKILHETTLLGCPSCIPVFFSLLL